MDDTSVRQHADRMHRVGRPAFDLLVSKLRRPPTRPGTIHRSSLIDQLGAGVGRAAAEVGLLVDDHAGGAGAG
jgi:hypothetical protein